MLYAALSVQASTGESPPAVCEAVPRSARPRQVLQGGGGPRSAMAFKVDQPPVAKAFARAALHTPLVILHTKCTGVRANDLTAGGCFQARFPDGTWAISGKEHSFELL